MDAVKEAQEGVLQELESLVGHELKVRRAARSDPSSSWSKHGCACRHRQRAAGDSRMQQLAWSACRLQAAHGMARSELWWSRPPRFAGGHVQVAGAALQPARQLGQAVRACTSVRWAGLGVLCSAVVRLHCALARLARPCRVLQSFAQQHAGKVHVTHLIAGTTKVSVWAAPDAALWRVAAATRHPRWLQPVLVLFPPATLLVPPRGRRCTARRARSRCCRWCPTPASKVRCTGLHPHRPLRASMPAPPEVQSHLLCATEVKAGLDPVTCDHIYRCAARGVVPGAPLATGRPLTESVRPRGNRLACACSVAPLPQPDAPPPAQDKDKPSGGAAARSGASLVHAERQQGLEALTTSLTGAGRATSPFKISCYRDRAVQHRLTPRAPTVSHAATRRRHAARSAFFPRGLQRRTQPARGGRTPAPPPAARRCRRRRPAARGRTRRQAAAHRAGSSGQRPAKAKAAGRSARPAPSRSGSAVRHRHHGHHRRRCALRARHGRQQGGGGQGQLLHRPGGRQARHQATPSSSCLHQGR